MISNITLITADGSEKTLSFAANATTAIRFRNLFRKDLMTSVTSMLEALGPDQLKAIAGVMANKQAGEALRLEDLSPEMIQPMIQIVASGNLETVQQLAYIMHEQAEKADMGALSEDTYLEWLEGFDTMTIMTHAMDFINLYMGQKTTSSELKKNSDQLTEK